MFGFFDSPDKKARTVAARLLEAAGRVFNYRRDVLAADLLAELNSSMETLRALVREKADAAHLNPASEALDAVLRRAGGTHYPQSSWTENVEFFLVAAIVILGVRAYFVQPFKIPTNSMWPSYNGMTPEVFSTRSSEPSLPSEALRFLTLGARPVRVDAPVSGEVLLPVVQTGPNAVSLLSGTVAGRSWLVFPAQLQEYRLLVGGQLVRVTVPADFPFDWAVRDTFFPSGKLSPAATFAREFALGHTEERIMDDGNGGKLRVQFLKTGRTVQAGERLLAFDILTGDQLFVDRISYHFIRPKVGDGFVFRTGNIHSPFMLDLQGRQIDSFYVKRLVGTPGDKLAVNEPVLYRNGQPITGAPAFEHNARQEGNYGGYFALMSLAGGQTVTVPSQSFFAMGDNSGNSADSRYWGFVPAAEVVGRPLFIYYPFTHRWGLAP